ncbi:MAG: hypothetical protein HY549_07005 [Elusimicrobia bacterium]|nr:hypothetical protein [Elusimicrobiota bacterium]
MRKIAIAVLSLLVCAGHASASLYSEFETRARRELITPFARDLGGLLGAASFYPGRALGFPGFELDAIGVVQAKPDKDNLILLNGGVEAFGLPLLRAGVGLPFNIDVAGHGLAAEGVTILGGGLRYGVFQSGLLTKFLPSVGLSFFADKVEHDDFKATHYAGNVSAVWELPIVKPFAGAGFDTTKLTVKTAQVAGITGLSETAKGYRLTAGLDVFPLPLVRLRGAYVLLHGIPGGMFSLGIEF